VQLLVWLNELAGAAAGVVFAPIAVLPGWLSATIIGALTGVLMLVAYKYTSNQAAIKRVRDEIKANLFSLKLFKDNMRVVFRAQGSIFKNALMLLLLSLVPMLVMIVPVVLIMTQLSLWYQQRPVRVGEPVIVKVYFNGEPDSPLPSVDLTPVEGLQVDTVMQAAGGRFATWKLLPEKADYYTLAFNVDGNTVEKQLAVGDGYMRASMLRPAMKFGDVVLYPGETPFGPDSPVESILIEYQDRDSWTSGTDMWVIYWFASSMVAAFALHKPLGVNI
jgi:hypothetical protein